MFTRGYAQTHVYKISVYKGFQWVDTDANDLTGVSRKGIAMDLVLNYPLKPFLTAPRLWLTAFEIWLYSSLLDIISAVMETSLRYHQFPVFP